MDNYKQENMIQSDQILLKDARKGNQKAIKSLYEKNEAYWFRICLRYGKNRNQAQDIFQEGVSKVFQAIHQFDSEKGSFYSWSNKIIVNSALKFLKKNQWQDSFLEINEIDHQLDLLEDAMNQISAKELITIIQKLPFGYRMVFNMYEIDGYSHSEIAQKLQISIGTSKSQLSKSKKALQQKISLLF